MSRLIDWKIVCLVCLKKGENRSIFERDNDSNLIVDKIIKCTDIFVEKNTNQPKSICLQCLDNLNVTHKFHRNYEQSESIIKALLSTNHKEFPIKDLWKTPPFRGAQQKESPQKQILHIEESVNLDDINIKLETIENEVVDDTHDKDTSPSIDLEDNIDSEAKLVVKDPAETCFQGSAIEQSDVKANKGNKMCGICNRAYKHLKLHMRRHNNERPFSCDLCDKAYVRSAELRLHMRAHTGEKPYECQYCDRRFAEKGQRKNHERTHTGERPFVCPTCGKTFAHSGSLSQHLRSHTAVKNFICEECGKRFKRRHHLESHIGRHLSRDKLDKSSEHKQKKVLEKEIFQIEECAKSNEINIKHEIIENDVVDDTHDNNKSPCIDLGDNIDTEGTLVLKDSAEACFQSGAIEQNDLKGSKSNNICGICNRAYKHLKIHMKRHNKERPFSCNLCDKAYVSSGELRIHMRGHTGEKPYECQYCDRRFAEKRERKNHERTHTGERPFVCPTCGKSFAYSNVLAKHRRIHTDVKKFMCEECGKGFDRRVLLERHVGRHLSRDKLDKSSENKQKKVLKPEIFQIEECAKSNGINTKHDIIQSDVVDDTHDNDNSPSIDLKDNIDTTAKLVLKNPTEASFQGSAIEQNGLKANKSNKICGICNRAYKHLKIHMKRHNKERPFSCDLCDKAYVSSGELRIHMRVHTGEKPYECQYCDRRFPENSQRKSHERTHTGEKPYKCQYCDRRFTQKSKRKTHERMHTGEKPYECQYCDHRFAEKRHRKIHERTHTGERPFVCSTCGKSFAYSHVLSDHRRIHTGVKKFMCEECGKGFNRRDYFASHVRRHLSRGKLDKSSKHEQKKVLEKEIFQIEECAKSNEINIKHEMKLIEEEIN